MTAPALELTRDRVLAHRRRVGGLDDRLPAGPESLRRAAWVGLQDSMPRAAVLSIHARVAGTPPDAWADPSLVQLWGPRYSAYVVAAVDRALFTLSRLPEDPEGRRFAESVADDVERFLAGRTMTYGEVGRGLGVNPNRLRYGAPTGRLLIRWVGAGQPTIRAVPRPPMEPDEARRELARRYVHLLGLTTAASFGAWAGIRPRAADAAFRAIAGELVPARSAIGDGWILASDEASFLAAPRAPATARLLPSGDAYWLLQGIDRELLVPDPDHRAALWTPRVWPGAVLIDGDIAGTWRRAGATVLIDAWRSLSGTEIAAVEAEAMSFPLAGLRGPIRVRWG